MPIHRKRVTIYHIENTCKRETAKRSDIYQKTALRGKIHPSFCERSKNDGVCKTIQFSVKFSSVWESNSCIPVANSSIWGANPSVRVTNRLASATFWAISSVISSFWTDLSCELALGRVTRYIYQKYPKTGMSNTRI